ncbi:U32 family peptidase [Methyloversatilis sp. XJ19-49]|uniref:peptidase U32 family protein n=1 Tax=Methyloversatilis sp. XJ19-49 TaxID=2963429 RepID=UPI00211C923F|nr:U32 family peptidase [Methyloversatilis sp. XJ19-49]MCQ9377421.1 U32 family peptidase [Methyloversatilis sp. XJ19-49]
MTSDRRILELLAPAKNADFGIEAINHGADAVYIGGPSFGARKGADNEVADIARLTAHAHRFHAKVFVAFNTILRDDELEPARQTIHQLYDAGVDALIVQDMGLLEMELPPIQLHASTQTDIRDAAKARFLQDVGFSQIVLARELTLEQIRDIASNTSCSLEFFVHGALCVAFSGQCFISHAHTARSANRGECSQACRLPYTLTDASGAVVAHDRHLLSMKDNDQSANLRALIDAGISSFKIEGRLKDLAYVKNITAHYRTLLDDILDDLPAHRRASSGRCTFFFTPQPEKSFNRGATDYFVNGRQHGIEAFEAPGFVGEEAATVTRVAVDHIEVESQVDIHNGDGLSYFDSHRELQGLRINTVHGKQLFPNVMPDDLRPGLTLFRNRDQAFERALEKKSSERRVAVDLRFADTPDGFSLTLTDEDGCTVRSDITHDKQSARDAERALSGIREAIAKLGNTMFEARTVTLDTQQAWFLPASVLNGLRRDGCEKLEAARVKAHARPLPLAAVEPPVPFTDTELSYLANVYNEKARTFYRRHGVQLIADAYELNHEPGEVSLMITKHCLRYSHNLCPKELKDYDLRGMVKAEPMTLMNGNDRLTLRFDCKKCEMHVVGSLRKSVPQAPAIPVTFHRSAPAGVKVTRSAN